MGTNALPSTNRSAEKYVTAMENLIERYSAMGKPVKYKEAAMDDMHASDASACLKYFGEVGFLNVEKQGVYVPKEELLEYFDSGFDPSSGAYDALCECLDSASEVFEEAVFFLSKDDYENEELADRIITAEDELSKGDDQSVVRFLEIFRYMGLIEGEAVSSAQSEEEQGSESVNSVQNGGDSINLENDIDEIEVDLGDLPTRGSPESLLEITKKMKQGGSWTIEALGEDDDLEFGAKKIRGSINLGAKFGFVKESEDEGYQLSEDGFQLAYIEPDDDDGAEAFQKALEDSKDYLVILKSINDSSGKNVGTITNKDVVQILRTEYGLIDASSDTLKRKTTVLFKTLEACGFGEYKQASGSYPTRFNLNKETTLSDVLQTVSPANEEEEEQLQKPNTTEIQSEHDGSVANGGTQSAEPTTANSSEAKPEVGPSKPNGGQMIEGDSEEDSAELDLQPEDTKSHDGLSTSATKTTNVDLNVEIDISELDTAELEAKLELLEDTGLI